MKLYIAIALLGLVVFELCTDFARADDPADATDMDKRRGWGKRGWGKRGWGKRSEEQMDDDVLDEYVKRGWGKRGWGKRGWGKRSSSIAESCDEMNPDLVYLIYKAVEAEAQRMNSCNKVDS
ncbi:unnamed protein product [Owenia fusiformis]|uniref:Uncharacterized protein n=1 Tax=Owenia fusiformis TaxID=6347 RepID=A0A8J1T775_OWEFU|nr:unnamed protein product [Owenia fusiformis]